jgi:hypothetical protein
MITISKTARLSVLFAAIALTAVSASAIDQYTVSLEGLKICNSAVPERVAQALRECLDSSQNFKDFHTCAPLAGFASFFPQTLEKNIIAEARRGDVICPQIKTVLDADKYDSATEAKIKREFAACQALQEVLYDIRKKFNF